MRRSLLPLNALRAFDAAARHKSFKLAAEEMSVTPAAISQQIRSLEEYLNVQLFIRDKNTLQLTKEAEEALPSLDDAFNAFETAVEILQKDEENRELHITLSPSFASKWLIPRLGRFYEQHENINVHVDASMAIVNFKNDEFDLGVRYGRGKYPGLYVEELMKEEVFPVCSPELLSGEDGIKTYKDLKKITLIHDDSSLEDESCPKWDMWLKAVGVTLSRKSKHLHFNSTQLTIEAALAGRGAAIAKGTIARDDLEQGRLVRLFARSLPVDFAYYIVCNEHKKDSPKVKAFMEWLRSEAKNI